MLYNSQLCCLAYCLGLIWLAFQLSPFACSNCTHVCYVYDIMYMLLFVPYALTLPVNGLSFMSIKICSVLLCSTIIVPFNKHTNLFAQLKCKSIAL